MPANYTQTTRLDGQTTTFYNDDHQNHINNRVPLILDDYSIDITQMKLNTNPGSLGSEILPTSLAIEIEELRYILSVIKNKQNWYETPNVNLTATFVDGALAYKTILQTLTNNVSTVISFPNENYDTGNYHDNVTNNSRLTPGVVGTFRFIFQVVFNASSLGTLRRATLVRNGVSAEYIVEKSPLAGNNTSINGNVILSSNATTDYFELFGLQDSGANLDILGISATHSVTFFSLERII